MVVQAIEAPVRPLLRPLQPLKPLGPLPQAASSLAPIDSFQPDNGWERFIAEARAISKQSLVPDPASLSRRETLPPHQSAPLRRAVLLLPAAAGPGLRQAIQDLERYLARVTGQPVLIQPLPVLGQPDLSVIPADATVIAIGAGQTHALLPAAPASAESFAIEARSLQAGGRTLPLVSLNGSDLKGQQYAVYRLLELSGKRFFHYLDDYAPDAGQAVMPSRGYHESYAPAANMAVRGFAPHLYHPMPLSDAFHHPSRENFEMMRKYIDWLVANRQNYVKLELLELDQTNHFLPIRFSDAKFRAWLPYARQIVDYAKARGVQVSVNVAFANYTSANTYAVNPLNAIWQSFRLNGESKDLKRAEAAKARLVQELQAVEAQLQQQPGNQALLRKRAQLLSRLQHADQQIMRQQSEYDRQVQRGNADNGKSIRALIDKLMAVPWDEISWNLGTSEFTPSNDDLTLGWMNEAAGYLRQRYPGVRTVVSSHTPPHPVSEKYHTPYFDLVKFADKGMGLMAHTVQAYSLTDKAGVYGAEDFSHKLKLMYETGKDRFDVYYPETSYWLGVDSDLPMFLPVYALNRAHDMAMVRKLPHADGQMTFTTGFEWGYWLNDYVTGRLQARPDASLTEILDGAFAIFGSAREPMTRLLIDTMLVQQTALLDQNLLGYLKGSSWLTDFGHQIKEIPILKELFDGTDTTPARLTPEKIQRWNLKQISDFELGDLNRLNSFLTACRSQFERALALEGQIPTAAKAYYQELCDGLQINLLRARQATAGMMAAVAARKADLLNQPALRAVGEQALAETRAIVYEALELVRRREQAYREPAALAYGKGKGLTMWKNRYLTDLHELTYWKRSYNEVARVYRAEAIKDLPGPALPLPAQGRSLSAVSFSLSS